MNLPDTLSAGLHTLDLDELQCRAPRLLEYLALLDKWNKVYNLTAVREQERMLTQHLLDSLAVLPYLHGESILDVGSGAGLPGIPLAITLPERAFTLLDSNRKRTAFLQQACIELKLSNVKVVCGRVEKWNPPVKFHIVISRAFSELALFVKLAGHLCAPGGAMLAMKGMFPYREAAELPENVKVEKIISLKVPALEAERHLVVMRVA